MPGPWLSGLGNLPKTRLFRIMGMGVVNAVVENPLEWRFQEQVLN
jgi:hypothetical protein